MNKVDKRIVKTKELIKNAFFNLLKSIGFARISVKAICEKANISRKTFYLHYETLDSLFDEIVVQLFPIASSTFLPESLKKYNELGDTEEFDAYYRSWEVTCLKQMIENSDEFEILLLRKNHDFFAAALKKNIRRHAPEFSPSENMDDLHFSYYKFKYNLYLDNLFDGLIWSYQQKELPAQTIIDCVHESSKQTLLQIIQLISKKGEKTEQ